MELCAGVDVPLVLGGSQSLFRIDDDVLVGAAIVIVFDKGLLVYFGDEID